MHIMQGKETTISEAATGSAISEPMGTPPGAPPSGMPDGGPGGAPGEAPGGAPGGGSSEVTSYSAVKSITSDTTIENETITSTGTDENAIDISNGATTKLNKLTVNRSSSDSKGGDNASFYGVGAAILNREGTSVISNSTITTDAKGGAGIFSYKDGITYVSDTSISTKQDTSGGIHAAGGGTLYAWNVNATTEGGSSAAIRSDRGGGKMVIDGGIFTSKGTGSPAIYSTADISVHNSTLSSENSEAICIEGRNSIHLFDTSLTGNMPDNSQNDCSWNVILYQSMSGDSEQGNSLFEMNGGTLRAKNGGMFYTTNTESTITLNDVDITTTEGQEFFLQCTGNNNQRGWGTSGANGADCLFTGIKQTMQGDVVWDSISQLDFYMTDTSKLTGAIKQDETYAGNGGNGYCNVYISKDSSWIVTGDSTLTNLYNSGTIVDNTGKTVTIKGTDGTKFVTGDSDYTITVTAYSTTANLSKASTTSNWDDYKVEQKTNTTEEVTSTPVSTPASTSSVETTKESATSTPATSTSSVSVKKTKIRKAKRSKNKKTMTVSFKKISGVGGYQIRYSTSKGFKKSKGKYSKSTTMKLKNLSIKKSYYIKVRCYVVQDGKTYYSKWSTTKRIK